MGAVNVTPQIVIARSIDEVAGRTDLSGYAQIGTGQVALRLNQRPRRSLGFETQRVDLELVLRQPPEPAPFLGS
jgi:hypothetical protein